MSDVLPKEKTCAFTGYRPEKMPNNGDETSAIVLDIKNQLYENIEKLHLGGFMYFMTGMSRGFDMWAAEAVIKLKKNYKNVHLIAAVPFIGQEYSWSEDDKSRYYDILKASRHTFLMKNTYEKNCYFDRNKFMVDSSACIIAYYDGRTGGTRHTVNYAKKSDVPVINLADLQETLF